MTRRASLIRCGDIVEVLSEEEILLTLDADGTLNSLPFMPEMRQFCGKRLRVVKRANKICIERPYFHLGELKDAVILEGVRCNGAAHDGCMRMCAIFWKEAWLRKVDDVGPVYNIPEEMHARGWAIGPIDPEKTYYCQSTAILASTSKLRAFDPRQYAKDILYRNFSFREVLLYIGIFAYNKFRQKVGMPDHGRVFGENDKTPAVALNLQPGEIVEVRSAEEIARTLDTRGNNRGLGIDFEMLQHCGRRFRVLCRIDRIILETTGRMRQIQNTVALAGTECSGMCKRGCTRGSYGMWREAWLRRINGSLGETPLEGQ